MATPKHDLIHQLLNTDNYSASLDDVKNCWTQLALELTYPIILVGGTNGKGSTCAYLTTILSQAGYKVGTYTSPHVLDYNERIAINNQAIDDASLCAALSQVMRATKINLGLFKTFTLASHIIFIQQQIDIAIIEVGLGGGRDVTNLFEPSIAAITGVALDHCHILGASIDLIAKEKAKIYRAHKPAFYGSAAAPTAISEYATAIQAKLKLFGHDYRYERNQLSWNFYSPHINYYGLPLPSLRGHEQLANASLALAILSELSSSFPLTLAQIKQGILSTTLLGRFQILPGQPQIVLDSAHNPQSIELMCQNMLKLPYAKHNYAIFSVADDKDWREIINLSRPHFDYWYLAPLASPRSCNSQEVANYLISCGVKPQQIMLFPSITAAFQAAYQQLKPEDRLLAFGSFLVVEAVYRAIQEVRK